MGWETPQEHIRCHLRGGIYDPTKAMVDQISRHNLRCLAGMIETGEITRDDLVAVGGEKLAGFVDWMIQTCKGQPG